VKGETRIMLMLAIMLVLNFLFKLIQAFWSWIVVFIAVIFLMLIETLRNLRRLKKRKAALK